MPNKMTDNEIIKAFKRITEYQGFTSNASKTLKDTLDLINRLQARVEKCEKVEHFADKTIATQQAEIKRLSPLANLGNMRANDYRVMRDRALKAEKEIERLKVEKDNLIRTYAECQAEAVKEVFEKIDERLAVHSFTSNSTEYSNGMLDCMEWVDSKLDELKKEMGVENDG